MSTASVEHDDLDQERLYHLYSTKNASELQQFWHRRIQQHCIKKITCRVKLETLEQEFTVRNIFPSSLKLYYQQAVRCRDLVIELKALNVKSAWSSLVFVLQVFSIFFFVIFILLALVKISLNILTAVSCCAGVAGAVYLYPRTSHRFSGKTEFIHVPTLQLISSAILTRSKCMNQKDRTFFVATDATKPNVFCLDGFLTKIASAEPKDESSLLCRDLLLRIGAEDKSLLWEYMVMTGCAVFSEDKSMMKIVCTDDVPTISIVDVARVQLASGIASLESRIEQLECDERSLTRRAAEYKASGRNRSALCELKLRRQKREQISCFETSIFKLKEAYETVEGSELNKTIIDGYLVAAAALKGVREHAGVTPALVEEARNNMQDELSEFEDIANALTGPLDNREEDDELIDELEALFKESSIEDSIHNNDDPKPTFSGSTSVSTTEINESVKAPKKTTTSRVANLS